MYGGIYAGKVTNINDPEKLFRIKALIPVVLGEQESDWAWPCVPPGWFDTVTSGTDPQGGSVSSHAVLKTPTPLMPVWIMFENGEIDRPVWLGTWRTRA